MKKPKTKLRKKKDIEAEKERQKLMRGTAEYQEKLKKAAK